MKPASRSAGTKSAPAAHYVRFTEAWNNRLHRAAKERGLTIQSFLLDAAQQAIGKCETELNASQELQERRKQEKTQRNAPIGLGLAPMALPGAMSAPLEEREPAPLPQIVVAATAPPPPDADLDRLARFVVQGPQWNRADRLRATVKILVATAPDAEERQRLTKALDAQIAMLEGKSPGGEDFFERVKKEFFG